MLWPQIQVHIVNITEKHIKDSLTGLFSMVYV